MSEEPQVPHVPNEVPLPPPPPPDAPSASSGCRQVFFGLVGFCFGSTVGMSAATIGSMMGWSEAGFAVALVATTIFGVGGVVLAVRGPWKPFGIGIALGSAACGLLTAACWHFSLNL